MNTKVASQLLDKIKEFADEHPDLLKGMLITGGLGAAGGAALTSTDDENESTASRVMRRVKNALLGAGLGAAAAGGIGYGLEQMGNALPEGDVSPEAQAATSWPARAFGAAALGTTGGFLNHRHRERNAKALAKALGKHPAEGSSAMQLLRWEAAKKGIGGQKGEELLSKVEQTLTAGDRAKASEILNQAGVRLSQGLSGNNQGYLEAMSKVLPRSVAKVPAGLLSGLRRNWMTATALGAGAALPEILSTGVHAVGPVVSDTIAG